MDPDSPGSSGGWVLTLATVLAAAALFAPLPGIGLMDAAKDWLAPGRVGAVLALALAALGSWIFRKRFWPKAPYQCRRLRSALALLVLQAFLIRGALELRQIPPEWLWPWWPIEAWLWTPWFLTTGLAVMLLGNRLAILLSFSHVFLLYLRADPGPLPLVGCLTASLLSIVLLRRPTRARVLRAGTGAGFWLAAVAVMHGMQWGGAPSALAVSAAVPLVIGVVSGFLVLALLPVMEWVLGELSDVTLVEYGSDHPLLDQLKEQALGTWHHTLNVADLAEKAAAAIGSRALFCRTAALYHDIGKLHNPGIFAENITGSSPHEALEPRVSAARIIEHVSYGLELARKHRLPKPFRDIIAEHHGTSVVKFFFNKAREQLRDGQEPDSLRPAFTYPGPLPSSRESGIVALADMVEAATRSQNLRSEAEAREYVRRLIADRLAEGQLAQCPLTLAQLAQVEDTFVAWVKARHHHRPAYPQTSAALNQTATDWAKPESAAQPI